ncbi:MAG TPA: potassium-transporting ATPase subunit KdpC [Candidatus Angelobacter sp.]|nr:potassium-transporting ATPase subunit KdpC [Candidatus Angelobacter sp.]
MRNTLWIALRFTLVTAVLLGIVYPLAVTGIAQLTMRNKANGQLIAPNSDVIGSALIGQNFASPRYFHGRPSAAGNGYDAANSGGSNLAQSNAALVDRIRGAIAEYQKQNPGREVPIELVTTSASGLDPDISPAAALYQVHTVATARLLPESTVRAAVEKHIQGRTFGMLGEARVNVLELNLDLDRRAQPLAQR